MGQRVGKRERERQGDFCHALEGHGGLRCTNVCHPASPGTIPHICLCLCVFSIPRILKEKSPEDHGNALRAFPGKRRNLLTTGRWEKST